MHYGILKFVPTPAKTHVHSLRVVLTGAIDVYSAQVCRLSFPPFICAYSSNLCKEQLPLCLPYFFLISFSIIPGNWVANLIVQKLKPEQKEAMLAELKAGRQPSLARARRVAPGGSSDSNSNSSGSSGGSSGVESRAVDASSSSSSQPSTPSKSKPSITSKSTSKSTEDINAKGKARGVQMPGQAASSQTSKDGEIEGDRAEGTRQQDSGNTATASAGSERWRLRRKLGTSFAARGENQGQQRRLQLRGRRRAASSSASDSDESDSDIDE